MLSVTTSHAAAVEHLHHQRGAGARQAGDDDDLVFHARHRSSGEAAFPQTLTFSAGENRGRRPWNDEPVDHPGVGAAGPRRTSRVVDLDRPDRRVGPERRLARVQQDVRPVPARPQRADPHEAVADRQLLVDRSGRRRRKSRRWSPFSRALMFQQTSRLLGRAPGRSTTSAAAVGLEAHARARATGARRSSCERDRRPPRRPGADGAGTRATSWPRSSRTGTAMTSIGTSARTNSRNAAEDHAPLRREGHRRRCP